jgi:hypothetical protein
MRRWLCGLAALPFLVGLAFAGQPVPLNDTQMDAVTAGAETSGGLTLSPVSGGSGLSSGVFLFSLSETNSTNSGTVMVNVDPVACNTCYLNIRNEALTLQAQFGPVAGSDSFSFVSH